jgi:hypothetical protein
MAGETLAAEMQALEDRRTKAVIAKDLATLDAMLSDGLLYCHSTGMIDSKAVFLDKIAAGRSIFHAFSAEGDAFSQPADNVRIMAGKLSIDVEIAGHVHEVRGRFLAVWGLRDGTWLLEAFQGVGG